MTLASRYTLLKLLGDGSFGSVFMAECKGTRETVQIHPQRPAQALIPQVAVKKMKEKYASWDECINLREVKVHLPYYVIILIKCG